MTEGLKLNPQADAEALAHAGVLVPLASQSLTKAEAPVTTSVPVTARQTVPTQAGIHAVPSSAPVPGIMPRQLQGLVDVAFPPQPAAAVAGTQVAAVAGTQVAPCPYPPHTAGLVAPSGDTAPGKQVERLLAHSRASASASTKLEDNRCLTDADQHHPTGNEVAGLCAVQPDCTGSKQTKRDFPHGAVVSELALELPSTTGGGMPYAIAAAAHKETGLGGTTDAQIGGEFVAGIGGTSGGDRHAKRQKVAAVHDLGHEQQILDRTAEMHHDESDSAGVNQGPDVHLLESTVQRADDSAVSLSPRLSTKDGSPITAAHIRVGMPFSRAKVPMRQSTEPKT